MNVLIIEDDPMIAKSLSLALTDEGHHSNICGTAEEGYFAARDHFNDGISAYDAIILDINLPDVMALSFQKLCEATKSLRLYWWFLVAHQQRIRSWHCDLGQMVI